MKAVHAIILVFALLLGANANLKPRQINRQVLEKRLRMLLKPGFRDEFEDSIAKFIDTCVRGVIKNGSPELGIPVCDPLVISHFDININQENLEMQGVVDNVVITGAANFKVVNVKADLVTLKAETTISLDTARVEGTHYNLTGTLYGTVPVYGEGRFQADLSNMTLNVKIEVGVKEDGNIELRTVELDVTLGSGKVNFENLMGGGTLGDVANDYVSSELPNLVQDNKGPILLEIASAIKDLGNKLLVNTTLDEVLDLINNPNCSVKDI